MEPTKKDETDVRAMVADYMENGFLDNIIDMFKHDHGLYATIGDLIVDERIRVRLGASALIESLHKDDPKNVLKAIPHIVPLLKDQNPVIRGDAAYLLGVIGTEQVIPLLNELVADDDLNVRMIAQEAVEEINAGSKMH